uniref:cAMP-responsive element-binding protein-like 2 n=1 Tax=Felis catus TaxID=9685 RepID=A0ABI7Z6I0_FELCA
MDDSKVVGGKVKKPGKRGRKPAKIDLKAKLERSRQSARECRARKKLRYQYLEELVSSRERAICALREELEMTLGGGCRNVKENRNLTISSGEEVTGWRRERILL